MSIVEPIRPVQHIRTIADANSVPTALKDLRQWVNWMPKWNAGRNKWSKIPVRTNGITNASSTNPETWSSFDEVIAVNREELGVGLVVTVEDGVVGIDLDNCRDLETGEPATWAAEIIQTVDSYCEVSPSGTGYRMFLQGAIPSEYISEGKHGRRTGDIEVYQAGRFLTVTGDHLDYTPLTVENRQEALNQFCSMHFIPKHTEDLKEYTVIKGDADREAVKDKTNALYMSDSQFKMLWDRNAKFSDQSASVYDLHLATEAAKHGWSDSEIIQLLFLQREKHGDDTGKLSRPDYINGTIGKARQRTEKTITFKLDDIGNGQRFASRYGDYARFIMQEKSWLLWDGTRWMRDEGGAVERLAEKTVRCIPNENGANPMELLKHAARSASTPKLESMLKRARTRCSISTSELDTDSLLLGVQNGILDLRTGNLLKGDSAREAYVTRHAGAAFDPAKKCPHWLAFLEKISGNDPEWVSYMQRVCGYLLTASTDERCFFMLIGSGANGKTVLLTVLQTLLAEYAQNMEIKFFMSEYGRGPASAEVARLQGARLVTATEADIGDKWSPALVKKLTGSDMLSGRALYRNTVQFLPSFKIMVANNYRPKLERSDQALLGRVREIPFTVTLHRKDQIKGLSNTLCGELSGILNWCVTGTKQWLSDGLEEPASVLEATETNCEGIRLGDDDNQVEKWYSEQCCSAPGNAIAFKDLYEEYSKWSGRKSERLRSTRCVGLRLKKLGARSKHTNKGKVYYNFKIIPLIEF